jgi:hypothetical protein
VRRLHPLVLAATLGPLAAALQARPCTPDWIPVFGGNELAGPVRALTTFDFDGPGPESPSLVALQAPTQYGGSSRRAVLRWTDAGWERVGGNELSASTFGPAGIPLQRGALAAFDPDGPGPEAESLYVCGGIFALAPAPGRRQIARFDGTAWQQVGTRFNSAGDRVFDMRVFDEDGAGPSLAKLYAAGEWGAQPMVASWDGATWTDMPFPGAEPTSYGLAVFDLESWDPDGPGSAPARLFACGTFACDPCGAGAMTYLAQWFNGAWHPVGAGLPDRPGIGLGMTTFDADGPGPVNARLVVVSEINDQDGGTTADITLWDGVSWTRIHSMDGVTDPPISSYGPQNGRAWVHDDDGAGPGNAALFVARIFEPQSQIAARLQRWNGAEWSAVGEYGPQMGININSQWLTSPNLLDAMTSFDFDGDGPDAPLLVVGGGFTGVWRGDIEECVVYPYVTDVLTTNMIATWDGEDWSTMNNGLSWNLLTLSVSTQSLASLDPDSDGPAPESLFVHGSFASAANATIPLRSCVAGYPASADAIKNANARYSSLTGWQRAGLDPDIDPRMNPRRILAVTDFDPDGPGPAPATKHIAGSFDQLDNTPNVGPLARWIESAGWQTFGQLSGGTTVHALLPFDPDGTSGGGPLPALLVAAGDFDAISFATSAPSGAVLAFDGELWTTTNFTFGAAVVTDLIAFDFDGNGPNPARLIAAGDFVQPTSLGNAKDIAQYDGVEWTPLGPPGGSFTGSADGSPARINALTIFNNALYAAGNFLQWTDGVTPVPARGLAKWNGTQWSPLPTNLDNPIGNAISITSPLLHDLIVFDPDGQGATPLSLFAAGYFTAPGGPTQGIARWDGAQWNALGAGLSFAPYSITALPPGVHDLELFDDDGSAGPNPTALFIVGTFLSAGPHSSWAIAKWGCESPNVPAPCPGDANNDNTVNFADITSVLTNFLLSGPEGDANHDGQVNFADITAVLTNFLIPCS